MEKGLMCKKSEENNCKQELNEFAKYADEHTNKYAFELLAQFKNKNKRANGVKLTRDTVGISAGLTYKYKNGFKFDVPHEKVKWEGEKQ